MPGYEKAPSIAPAENQCQSLTIRSAFESLGTKGKPSESTRRGSVRSSASFLYYSGDIFGLSIADAATMEEPLYRILL